MPKLALLGGEPVFGGEWPEWPQLGDRERGLVAEVLTGGNWSYKGPMETMFRERWAEFCGTKYAVPVANGTVSLQLIFEALDIGWGDEVIVPVMTWQATAAAVVDVNAVPVLVDIEPDSWCIDPLTIEAAITPRTKAIVAVHLYGTICDMDSINAIAQKHSLFVVEDCAHQHGSMFRGKKAGSIGVAGSFSLQNSKPLTSGEGGVITTDSDELAQRLDALRNCGRRPVTQEVFGENTGNYLSEGNFIQSGNYRITEFQAAVLVGQLERLPDQLKKRDENALYLRAQLEEIPGIQNVRRQQGTELQSYFNFAFRYDPAAFGGLSAERFREALTAEVNFPFTASYQPLNKCDLYCPLTKRRHRISPEYERAIDPARFNAPVAADVYERTSVCAHHKFLLSEKSAMDSIAAAVSKIQSNYRELL